jgi:DNA-binding Xre family transcriptional regulator
MKGPIMTQTKKQPPKLVLTPEQRAIVEEVRRLAEAERPEMIAEGRRIRAAEEVVSVQLRGVVSLLKSVRVAHHVSLAELAARTGMSKASLSRLENDPTANVTINTLYRIATALKHDLQVSIAPWAEPEPKRSPSRRPTVSELSGKVK